MKTTEPKVAEFTAEIARLLLQLIPTIGDDYRASEDDETPGMCVTVGGTVAEDGAIDWHYQTGDNSYSGGAYGHRNWGVVSLYRDSNCEDLARDVVGQVMEGIAETPASEWQPGWGVAV